MCIGMCICCACQRQLSTRPIRYYILYLQRVEQQWQKTETKNEDERTNERTTEVEKMRSEKKKHNKQTNKTRKFPVILSRHSVVTKTLLCMRVFYPKGLPYARHTTVS